MQHEVFISYSSENKAIAQAACHVIEEKGVRCWMAPRDIPAGEEYGDVIADAISDSRILVLIFSQSASISPWVKSELNLAISEQLHVIPFRIDRTPLEGGNKLILNKIHWIDAYPQYEDKLEVLAMSVLNIINNNSQYAEKALDVPVKPKRRKRYLLLSALLFVVLSIGIICAIKSAGSTFSYDDNGITVSGIKNLTSRQQMVIQEILDNMVYVEGGSFYIGNMPKGDSVWVAQDKYGQNRHEVHISSFYMSKYEVTQKQWLAFMDLDNYVMQLDENLPMDYLSWNACMEFVNKLNLFTGLHFSIPTEAQWEYAARGGMKSQGFIYSGSDNVDDVGWISVLDSTIHKPGILDPNELGLYDMTGNVAEWCYDYFDEYGLVPEIDPDGPPHGKMRVIRGGNINTDVYDAKLTVRQFYYPDYNAVSTGLRLCLIK